MSKVRVSAVLLSLVLLVSLAPLSVSAPASVSAAATATNTSTNTIKVQAINVKMVFDGVNLQPPVGQHVFIYNNSTYVPLRFMSYALQKSVSWDAKNLKVTVSEPSSSELVVIKEFLMNATNDNGTSVVATNVALNDIKASYVFGGSTKSLPDGQASYLLNGTLYVPLRFLSEAAGNSISWDQKTKTITAASATYKEQTGANNSGSSEVNNNTKEPSGTAKPSATPAPTGANGAASGGGGGAGSGKVSYESITSETEAKLNALKAESQSTLLSIAMEYVAAKDDVEKKNSIKAKGIQQLASFKASFNSIVADAEQKLNNNGYSTAIIGEYRSAFEAALQQGMSWAKGMAD